MNNEIYLALLIFAESIAYVLIVYTLLTVLINKLRKTSLT